MSGYLFAMVVLIGLWASEDDHDTLDVGVAILVILIGTIFPLLQVVALRPVLAGLNDLTFVSLTVPGQVIHREAVVLTRLVCDLVEFSTASTTLLGLVAILFFGISHELTSPLMILLR